MERRKKILFMSSWYPVEQNPTHGIFVQRHAAAVAMLNDVCVLYVHGKEDGANTCIKNDQNLVREYLYAYNKSGMRAGTKFKMLSELYAEGFEKIMKEWGRPDIIHLNVIFPAGHFAARLAKKYNIPLVITEHWTGYLPEDGSYKGFLKKWFTGKTVKAAAALCPVTRHLAAQMQAHGLSGTYMPVPNVVDTDFFSLAPAKTKADVVFMHLSSFDERQKNPRIILEAFAGFCAQHRQSKLIMAGDGTNLEELKVFANHVGIPKDNITFHFRPMGKDLLALFHTADVLLLCSAYENLPVVLLEAMSCGLPVISSDVGGISEYINADAGLLFSDISVAGLSRSMEEFYNRRGGYDKEFIRKRAINFFSYPSIAKKFDDVYTKVLQLKK